MVDARNDDQDLNRLLDRIASGQPVDGTSTVDPELVELFRSIRGLAQVPPTESARRRLGSDVDRAIAHLREASTKDRASLNGFASDARSTQPISDNRRSLPALAKPVRPHATLSSRSSRLRWLAAIAIVVLGIGAAYFIGRTDADRRDDQVAIPAAVESSATAVPKVAERELFSAIIPAQAIPSGDAAASFDRLTLPPGARTMYTDRDNIQLRYVLAGELTVRVDGDVQLFRANGDGAAVLVPANTEIILGAGDAALFLGLAPIEFSNPGTEATDVLGLGLRVNATGTPPANLSDWIVNDYVLSGVDAITLTGRPGLLRFSRVVMDPDASRVPASVDGFQLTLAIPDTRSGTPVAPLLSYGQGGRIENFSRTPATLYVVSLEFPGADGTPIEGS